MTCTSGKARVIDFAIVSSSLEPLLQGVEPEHDVPCAPHVGFTANLRAMPKAVEFPLISTKKKIPKEDCEPRKKAGEGGRPKKGKRIQDRRATWKQAMQKSGRELEEGQRCTRS